MARTAPVDRGIRPNAAPTMRSHEKAGTSARPSPPIIWPTPETRGPGLGQNRSTSGTRSKDGPSAPYLDGRDQASEPSLRSSRPSSPGTGVDQPVYDAAGNELRGHRAPVTERGANLIGSCFEGQGTAQPGHEEWWGTAGPGRRAAPGAAPMATTASVEPMRTGVRLSSFPGSFSRGTGLAMATAMSAALVELSEEKSGVGSAVLQAVNKTGARSASPSSVAC